MPDAYVIIFLVIAAAALATYVIPAGYFATKEMAYEQDGEVRTRQVIDPDTFQYARDAAGQPAKLNVSLFSGEAHQGAERIHHFPSDAKADIGFFNYAFEGMTSGSKYGAAVGVMAFILVIGGAFGIVSRTGAIEVGILNVIHRTRGRDLLLIPVLFLIFSLGGAVFGMGEEAIAFAVIVTPLMVKLGYDSITAVMITYGATQIGFATSWMNPFSISVAQGLAEVPVLSGAGFRMVMWTVFTTATCLYVLRYARRVKRDPTRSLAHASDHVFREQAEPDRHAAAPGERFSLGHGIVLGVVTLGLVWVIHGVTVHQYYIPEIATQFFIMGVVAGLVGAGLGLRGMRINDIAVSFRQGASDLLGAAMIVGMAKGIVLILGGDDSTAPSVLNTVLYQVSHAIEPLPAQLSALGMLAFQSGLNFFIPSGSGQAALTVPLMAPLADLAGLSRQVAVLAFQLGDGFTNLIIPTSASLMGTLAVARLDYVTWFRFFWKVQLLLLMGATAAILIAVSMGYQ